MAAELIGRVCHAIEINPAYVDVAIQRWQTFTGKDAIHAETGKTYEDMKDARFDPAKNSAGCYDDGIKALREKHVRSKTKDGKAAKASA